VSRDVRSGCCCIRFTSSGRRYHVIVDTLDPFEGAGLRTRASVCRRILSGSALSRRRMRS
jgi:hypothetical protein